MLSLAGGGGDAGVLPNPPQKTPVMGGKSPYTATSVTLGESGWIPKGIWCFRDILVASAAHH